LHFPRTRRSDAPLGSRTFKPDPKLDLVLRPGGVLRTAMRSPGGEVHPNVGCFLEIIPNQRLVFTDALGPGFRPSENPFFTAAVPLESQGKGTPYTAVADPPR
jgi:uncharacterized protein YndB with AHSA1/START domain